MLIGAEKFISSARNFNITSYPRIGFGLTAYTKSESFIYHMKEKEGYIAYEFRFKEGNSTVTMRKSTEYANKTLMHYYE